MLRTVGRVRVQGQMALLPVNSSSLADHRCFCQRGKLL